MKFAFLATLESSLTKLAHSLLLELQHPFDGDLRWPGVSENWGDSIPWR